MELLVYLRVGDLHAWSNEGGGGKGGGGGGCRGEAGGEDDITSSSPLCNSFSLSLTSFQSTAIIPLPGDAAPAAAAPAKKELKTTIKKQKMKPKGGKSAEDSRREKEREGKVSVSIRTAQGVPLKKMIDQDTKLKVAIEELLAIEGEGMDTLPLLLSCLSYLAYLSIL
jgi:hypothetical protein